MLYRCYTHAIYTCWMQLYTHASVVSTRQRDIRVVEIEGDDPCTSRSAYTQTCMYSCTRSHTCIHTRMQLEGNGPLHTKVRPATQAT